MRVLTFALAALLLGSMPPPFPAKLSPDAPQVLIRAFPCPAAQRDADYVAEALGFSQARLTCGFRTVATLERPTNPRMPIVSNLVTYGVFDGVAASPRVSTEFEVASGIPFAAAESSLVAYVKLDALEMHLQVRNALTTAFALEDAGISRNDITNQGDPSFLDVRVRPITAEQMLKVVRVAKRDNRYVSYRETGFIRDCNGTVASLAGLALADAHRRALAMAQAARARLGSVLGVVDSGGSVTDAVCGFGSDATIRDLSIAAMNNPSYDHGQLTPPSYATVVRTISAAWRLVQPPNPPGPSWYENPDFRGFWWQHDTGAFVADGLRARGDVLWPKSLEANQVFVMIPDQAYEILAHSPYSSELTYLGLGLTPLYPTAVLSASNPLLLEKQIAALQTFVSKADPSGEALRGWSFYFGRADCSPDLNNVVYQATRAALARMNGKLLRYLVEVEGTTYNVGCTPYPVQDFAGPTVQWSDSSVPQKGATSASVIAGY